MSGPRKRSGTTTAARSPPSKKNRTRNTGTRTSQSSKDVKAALKASNASQKDRQPATDSEGDTGEPSSRKTRRKGRATTSKSGSAKSKRGGQSLQAKSQSRQPTLATDGLEITEDGGQGKSGQGRAGNKRDSDVVEESSGETDSEEELNTLIARWTSYIYAFYDPVPTIEYKDGRRAHSFKCAARGCTTRVRRFLDTQDASSTSSLRNHAESCWGIEAVRAAKEAANLQEAREKVVGGLLKTGSITTFFERKKGKVMYSHRAHTRVETRTEIARWVCESNCPFKIVSDRGFLSLMKTGRPGYYIPSPSTVARDVKAVFARSRNRIAKMLQEYDGRLSFATDAWTSPNHRAFVAVTVYFEHQGEPIILLLDVVEVAVSHSGVHLAAAFADILKEFGIMDKCLAIACDNASNNDTMIDKLADTLPEFDGQKGRVRCFLHILNLVAKSLLRQFDAGAVETDELTEAGERQRGGLTEGIREFLQAGSEDLDTGDDSEGEDDDLADDFDEVGKLSAEDRAKFEKDVLPVRLVLAKIRALSFKIIHSTTRLLPVWKTTCERVGLPERLLPRDVRTRWNSTYEMLEAALKYRKAIDKMCADKQNKLRELELTAEEWGYVRQLRSVLKVFKDATSFFSSNTPNLAKVIPAMDHIENLLSTANKSPDKYSFPVRVSCGLANRTLNRYYSYSDMSITYRIAMILTPFLKLEYFKKMHWPESWRKRAYELLVSEYQARYAGRIPRESDIDIAEVPVTPPPHSRTSSAAPSEASVDEDMEEHSGSSRAGDSGSGDDGSSQSGTSSAEGNIFESLEATFLNADPDLLQDELEHYLAADAEHAPDPLKWWHDRRAVYPNLSRMALAYLTIPASSVEVERVFSRGRLLFTHTRNRMTAQTTRAVMCVASWSVAGYVQSDDAKKIAQLDDVDLDGSDFEMDDGWDRIDLSSLAD